MKSRQLGNSDLHISEIGFGCMSLPMEKQAAQRIIDCAVDAGITFFDTADLYNHTENEKLLGDTLKKHRQHIFIGSKVGNVWNEDGESWHWDASKQHIIEGVKNSLHRLQTDYLDFYQLHGGTLDDNFEEVTDAFEQLKREGLIRAYGISSIRPNVLKTFLPMSSASAVMMQHSLLDRRPEEWFDFIESEQASVITRGSIAKGLLTNEWQKRLERTNSYVDYSKDELKETLQKLSAQSPNLLETAISYNLSFQAVSSLIIGASNEKQLEDVINAYHNPRVADLETLQTITKASRYTAHRE